MFSVTTGPEWHTVPGQLADEDENAEGNLGRALREAMEPVVARVRAEALALPSHGPKHTGLRARLAAGVDVDAAGQRVRIVAGAEPGEEALPRGMDSGIRGWRHPVYGNQNVWVQQRGGSWFREPISDSADLIERRLADVVDEMAMRVAAAGLGP